jgi:hypothetical protein
VPLVRLLAKVDVDTESLIKAEGICLGWSLTTTLQFYAVQAKAHI